MSPRDVTSVKFKPAASVSPVIVNDVEILSEPGGAVRNRGGPSHHDECDLVVRQCGEEGAEIGHGFDCRAARPARRISSAKRASAMAFRKRSSTLSDRFSRMSVRSIPSL